LGWILLGFFNSIDLKRIRFLNWVQSGDLLGVILKQRLTGSWNIKRRLV
jgi:hypothetical protein